uniref:Activating transcription factor 4 n=1 Tax=Artemia sinica TaxID=112780 RepID=A0A248XBC9_9CRUS|nr:activating transcription factor 4 [Artemia sinica]
MSIQYIMLDPQSLAALQSGLSIAEKYDSNFQGVTLSFSGDNGLLDDIYKITEPYSVLFSELEDFEPQISQQPQVESIDTTSSFQCEELNGDFPTPPASPPINPENETDLLTIANELLDWRNTPAELDSLFESVKDEVEHWDCVASSPESSSSMSWELSSSVGHDSSSIATEEDLSVLSPNADYASSSITTEGDLSLTRPASEHSYSRPFGEKDQVLPPPRLKKVLKTTSRAKYPAEVRKLRKKEQNKQAAIRYRLKKKEEELRFASYEKQLIKQNKNFVREANKVRAEIRIIKSIMKEHFIARGMI